MAEYGDAAIPQEPGAGMRGNRKFSGPWSSNLLELVIEREDLGVRAIDVCYYLQSGRWQRRTHHIVRKADEILRRDDVSLRIYLNKSRIRRHGADARHDKIVIGSLDGIHPHQLVIKKVPLLFTVAIQFHQPVEPVGALCHSAYNGHSVITS